MCIRDRPIPKDCFGFTVRVTTSPFSKPWAVDIDMVDLIFSILAVSWVKLDSIEYLKSVSLLFELNDLKNNPSVLVVSPTSVVKPMRFLDLLITNNVCVSPDSGILNVALSPALDATIRVLPPFVKVTCWFCVNGWLGMNIL